MLNEYQCSIKINGGVFKEQVKGISRKRAIELLKDKYANVFETIFGSIEESKAEVDKCPVTIKKVLV